MSTKSKRTFYKTIVQVEILSEQPYSSTDLEKINDDITNGQQVGNITLVTDSEEIDAKTCAAQLSLFGTDPEFFLIDINGHDIEPED